MNKPPDITARCRSYGWGPLIFKWRIAEYAEWISTKAAVSEESLLVIISSIFVGTEKTGRILFSKTQNRFNISIDVDQYNRREAGGE